MQNEHLENHDDWVPDRIPYLLSNFINKRLTKSEADELENWVNASARNMEIFEQATEEDRVLFSLQAMEDRNIEFRLEAMKSASARVKRKRVKVVRVLAVAAALIAAVSTVVFFGTGKQPGTLSITHPYKNDIAPGKSAALLKTDEGKLIRLSDKKEHLQGGGMLAQDGELRYKANEGTGSHELRTAKKEQYRVELPDGTKVWMNAQSSIKYLPSFDAIERRIKLTGEAFFEIAKDPKRPFIVEAAGNEVLAIGTKFNVRALTTESHVTVTLVEGAVTVNNKLLHPNQQAEISADRHTIREVDAAALSEWRNDRFVFTGATVKEIMRGVQDWFGATIVYQYTPPYHFNVDIERNVPVSKLLSILQQTGQVHFSISNDTITVMK